MAVQYITDGTENPLHKTEHTLFKKSSENSMAICLDKQA
jgi:hypothetical protein